MLEKALKPHTNTELKNRHNTVKTEKQRPKALASLRPLSYKDVHCFVLVQRTALVACCNRLTRHCKLWHIAPFPIALYR